MWQKCPICNGLGTVPSEFTAARTTCTVCLGARIISEVNGLPPAHPDTRDKKLYPQQSKEKE